jgi:hypothetical protein
MADPEPVGEKPKVLEVIPDEESLPPVSPSPPAD